MSPDIVERVEKKYGKPPITTPPSGLNTTYTQSRTAFASLPSIFVPETETNDPAWAEPQDCLWNSPIEMLTKYTLARAYTPTFQTSDDSFIGLETFFVRTLGVPNCSWEHVVDEIRDYTTGIVFIDLDLGRARELYKCLSDMGLQGIALSKLK